MLLTFMYGKISPVAIYVYYIKRNALKSNRLASISILVRELLAYYILIYIYLLLFFFSKERINK